MDESELHATTAALAAKTRVALHRHRERNVDLHRMAAFALKAQHARDIDKQRHLALKGAVQPARLSIFEPMIFARLTSLLHPCLPFEGGLLDRPGCGSKE